MPSIKELAEEIEGIQARNKKVEADKAWETSFTRRFLVALLTYFVVVILFLTMGLPKPFESALIPALAFFLSTLTLGIFKSLWLKSR